MKLAFDVSSIIWTALLGGKDTEGKMVLHEGRQVLINTADFGYEKLVDRIVLECETHNVTPIDCIFVVEGMSSKSPRIAIDPLYKSGTSKPKEAYVEFQKLRDEIKALFKKLGSLFLQQDYAEADDVLGWLAANTEEGLVIITGDNDLAVLNGVNAFGAQVDVSVSGIVGQNKYGNFPYAYITLYKSLVGDTSDKITGIPGFGVKAWEAFESRFGVAGMDLLTNLIQSRCFDDLYHDAQQDKLVKKIYEGQAHAIKCHKLATIHPEWVDTMNDPLQWEAGMVHGEVTDRRLTKWAAVRTLVTAKNWEAFAKRAEAQIVKRSWMALDIETSTDHESDAWLEAQGDADGVDVIGSKLTGMSLTFGQNMQFTVYIPVDHADTDNVPIDSLRDWLADVCKRAGVELVIHNTMFEGPVLFQHWGEHWKDNGYLGFLPNWNDTRFCASYVDENDRLGLKHLSKKWLDYDQVDYKTTTTLQGLGLKGGKPLGEVRVVDKVAVFASNEGGESVEAEKEVFHMEELRQYKMRELSARHVFNYACDDTVTTAAIFNFCKTFMHLEHTYSVMKRVEIDASYLHAQSFVQGFKCDLAKLQELQALDEKTLEAATDRLSKYLIAKGWEGTICPTFSETLTVPNMKLAHEIVTGTPLETAVRTPSKAIHLVTDEQLKDAFVQALEGRFKFLNNLVRLRFAGKPAFNGGSPKQLARLLYEVMENPIRVYNKPTPAMRTAGIRQGSPSTDALAIAYAMRDAASPEVKDALEALKLIKMVQTRQGLYYSAYPNFVHWKTGLIHSSHQQCATNTRRASSARPNSQQMPKHPKIEGQPARFREVVVPHKKNAVIVSMDFVAQEMRVIAEYSQDSNLLACYVGDSLKDMHTFTGLGIAQANGLEWSYESLVAALEDSNAPEHKQAKSYRALGKKVNFTTEFGAQAPKLAATLMVDESTAQTYLEAREEAFPVVKSWKGAVIGEAKIRGYVTSMCGAKRHLRAALMSNNRQESSKAERQAVNYKVQGSAAEMTKLAEGRIFRRNLTNLYDARIIGVVHDEILASVCIDDLNGFIPAMHACMVEQFADMQVPVLSSISFGPSFGEQFEIGDQPTPEAIANGLRQMQQTQTQL